MYYIYILCSETLDKFYIDHTNHVERRILEHNNNLMMTYTHKYRPWKLMVSFEVSESRSDAMKMEQYIKKLKNQSLLRKMK